MTFLSGIIFTIFYLGLFDSGITRFEKQIEKSEEDAEIKSAFQSCPKGKDRICELIIYKRLTQIRPNDLTYKANLAMSLTASGDYLKAKVIYKELEKQAFSTYDLFAAEGRNNEALGDFQAASESYFNTLAIVPNLVDVVANLSRVLIKLNRLSESLSLLESFTEKYSTSEKYLQAQIISTRNLMSDHSKDKSSGTLKLMAIQGFHHFLPIKLASSEKAKSFLVDTGATMLSVSTAQLKQASEEAFRKAKPIKLVVADGRTIKGYFTVLPTIEIGQWKIKNVETTFCEQCENLVGKSVLKNFRIISIPKKGVEILELSRDL